MKMQQRAHSPSPPEADWVSERTTIKWFKYLTFRRFPVPPWRDCRELQLLSRDLQDGRATGQLVPRYRGIGSETYLNGTSQGPTPEDARKDVHIRGRSKSFMRYPG